MSKETCSDPKTIGIKHDGAIDIACRLPYNLFKVRTNQSTIGRKRCLTFQEVNEPYGYDLKGKVEQFISSKLLATIVYASEHEKGYLKLVQWTSISLQDLNFNNYYDANHDNYDLHLIVLNNFRERGVPPDGLSICSLWFSAWNQ